MPTQIILESSMTNIYFAIQCCPLPPSRMNRGLCAVCDSSDGVYCDSDNSVVTHMCATRAASAVQADSAVAQLYDSIVSPNTD